MKRVLTFLSLSVVLAGSMGFAKGKTQECRTKRVVVVPYPFRDGTAQRAVRDFTTAAAMDPCLSLTNIYTLLEGEDNQALLLVDEAQQDLKQGMRAFAAGSYDKAAELLRKAVRLYLPNYAAAGMSRDVTDAYLYLGSALAALNKTRQSEQAFLMALTLDPTADIYSVTSIPDATDVFQQVRDGIPGRAEGGLEVDSNPKGALVYVDGSFKGSTPITVKGLKTGKHVVTLMMVGFRRETRVVDVPAGGVAQTEPVKLTSTARATLLGRAITRLLKHDNKAYVDAKSLLAADFLVVCRKNTMGMETFLFDLDHRLAFSRKQDVKGVAKAKQVLEGLTKQATRKLEARIPTAPVATKKASSSIVKKWWFWTAIGAVVVGGTTAAILLTRHHGTTGGMKKDGTGAIIVEF